MFCVLNKFDLSGKQCSFNLDGHMTHTTQNEVFCHFDANAAEASDKNVSVAQTCHSSVAERVAVFMYV
jgi:hypothetical protein